MSQTVSPDSITINAIYLKLSEKVSNYNARLMLRSAVVTAGVSADEHAELAKEEARAICLALINKGGPAFQVGRSLYQSVQ